MLEVGSFRLPKPLSKQSMVPGILTDFRRISGVSLPRSRLFEGYGQPAPIAPPTNLVVTGFYRRVRNPIYVALLIILLGEALLFGDGRVAAWGVLFWLFTFAVVVIYEEPTLRQQFGEEYRTYCKNVPRWVPRVIPYKPSH